MLFPVALTYNNAFEFQRLHTCKCVCGVSSLQAVLVSCMTVSSRGGDRIQVRGVFNVMGQRHTLGAGANEPKSQ